MQSSYIRSGPETSGMGLRGLNQGEGCDFGDSGALSCSFQFNSHPVPQLMTLLHLQSQPWATGLFHREPSTTDSSASSCTWRVQDPLPDLKVSALAILPFAVRTASSQCPRHGAWTSLGASLCWPHSSPGVEVFASRHHPLWAPFCFFSDCSEAPHSHALVQTRICHPPRCPFLRVYI